MVFSGPIGPVCRAFLGCQIEEVVDELNLTNKIVFCHRAVEHPTERDTVDRSRMDAEAMLLLRTEKLPDGDDWIHELKLDGYRALAIKTGGKVQLRSRNDNDFSLRYPAIAKALTPLSNETVIDGEVVAFNESLGRDRRDCAGCTRAHRDRRRRTRLHPLVSPSFGRDSSCSGRAWRASLGGAPAAGA
jgi:ATP-dependent DNA ligase